VNFREQVFLALCRQQCTIHAEMFLKDAQVLADKCCIEWGHEWTGRRSRCRRCGRTMMDARAHVRHAEPPPERVKAPTPLLPTTTSKRTGTRVFGRTRP
jgi:hypothetical protein